MNCLKNIQTNGTGLFEGIKRFVFILVFLSLIAQPISKTFVFFDSDDYDLVDVEPEEENQEKDIEEKKFEAITYVSISFIFNTFDSLSYSYNSSLHHNFISYIDVPPPDLG